MTGKKHRGRARRGPSPPIDGNAVSRPGMRGLSCAPALVDWPRADAKPEVPPRSFSSPCRRGEHPDLPGPWDARPDQRSWAPKDGGCEPHVSGPSPHPVPGASSYRDTQPSDAGSASSRGARSRTPLQDTRLDVQPTEDEDIQWLTSVWRHCVLSGDHNGAQRASSAITRLFTLPLPGARCEPGYAVPAWRPSS